MTAVKVPKRAIAAIAMASFLGFAAFFWPFGVPAGSVDSAQTAPLLFGMLLLIVLAVVFAEIADGRIDAKALAMLGVLSAINAALRPLGAGTAGIETVFFVLVLAGRVFGPGFGFTLGCTSLFASALLTGGIGPWMPYQMFGCAWVGMLAGLLPKAKGKKEIVMLAAYAAFSGYLFGFLMNLSFWPFSVDPNSSVAYESGLAPLEQLQRYLVFFSVTSLGWDTGRAVTSAILVALAGPAVLGAFRRAARRARFQAKPVFTGARHRPPAQREDGGDLEGGQSSLRQAQRDDAPPADAGHGLQHERAHDHPKAEQG
jgi:energy-coupling factor transport system substrate-specific component